MVALANQIPIKGGNVVNVVYDATAFAVGDLCPRRSEAYQRPSVYVDLTKIDAAGNDFARP